MVKKSKPKRRWFSRKKSRRRKTSRAFPLSMAPSAIVPIAAILGGGGSGQYSHTGLIKAFQSGDLQKMMTEMKNIVPYEIIGYGWDGKWDMSIPLRNGGLILGGLITHKLANASGINKYMRKIPIIGKYVNL